jgi:hypothetical protein
VSTLKNWWWNPSSKYAASIECEGTIIQLAYDLAGPCSTV